MASEQAPRRRGRRPATHDTRGTILDAARAEFAEKGYAAASLRGIARRAEVDAALVHHYFDGKPGLFAEIMAMPVDVRRIVADLTDGPREEIGERAARTFLGVWDPPERRERFVALILSATADERPRSGLREFVSSVLLSRLTEQAGPAEDAALRASLAASHLIGVAVLRYVVGVEPLASASVDDVVAHLAPTLQRYLAPDA